MQVEIENGVRYITNHEIRQNVAIGITLGLFSLFWIIRGIELPRFLTRYDKVVIRWIWYGVPVVILIIWLWFS